MINKEEAIKTIKLSDKIHRLYEEKDITQSDLQSAVEAVIMQAIAYGKSIKS